MASRMFDLPEPLRPVIALNEASQPVIEVRTGYDLKPSSTSSSIRMALTKSYCNGRRGDVRRKVQLEMRTTVVATNASRPITHGHAPPSNIREGFWDRTILSSSRLVMSTQADLEFTDLSDLTELSSDDETASSNTKGSKGKQPAKDSFVLKNTLRPPRSVSYTTKWLHGMIVRRFSTRFLKAALPTDQLTLQHIDLDPEYQVLPIV